MASIIKNYVKSNAFILNKGYFFLIYSKNTDESLHKFRQMERNENESLDKARCMKTSVHESLNESRQI